MKKSPDVANHNYKFDDSKVHVDDFNGGLDMKNDLYIPQHDTARLEHLLLGDDDLTKLQLRRDRMKTIVCIAFIVIVIMANVVVWAYDINWVLRS